MDWLKEHSNFIAFTIILLRNMHRKRGLKSIGAIGKCYQGTYKCDIPLQILVFLRYFAMV